MLYRVVADLDPRYRESAEESLVETAQLMASLVEQDARDGAIDTSRLEPLFKSVYARKFEAHIFSVTKRRVELRLYVTDRSGRVLFDSLGHVTGADFSQWRDIRWPCAANPARAPRRTWRATRATSVMYVSAPVRWNNDVIGAVSVGKPVQSFGQFVEAARRKTLYVGLVSVAGVLLLALIVSVWLVRPFGLIGDYVRYAAGAAPLQPAAPGPARAGGDRRCLRRNARCPGRPQLRRRLRPDPHPRGQEPAVGHSRRG